MTTTNEKNTVSEMSTMSRMDAAQRPVRVIVMGTPAFAVPTLRMLAEGAPPGRIWPTGLEVVGVVTRPDKPV
ncbi:MAG TPA: hypothetical protein VIC27_14520, partial [Ktedonobacterales bacterium]